MTPAEQKSLPEKKKKTMPEKILKFLPEKITNHPEKKFETVPEKNFQKWARKTISARKKKPKKYQKPFSRALFIFSGKKKTLLSAKKIRKMFDFIGAFEDQYQNHN